MKTYHITAYDHTTPGTLEKRMQIRPDHIYGVQQLKASGNFVIGGAFLNEQGEMIGSALVLRFNSDTEMEQWKASEPYITQNVWASVEIKAFKVAEV